MSTKAPTRTDSHRIIVLAVLGAIVFALYGATSYAIQRGTPPKNAYGLAAAAVVAMFVIPVRYSIPLALAGVAWVLRYRYGVGVPR